ncbi:MAG: hypothetical protein KME45_31440 [Stenomitos rutilans HA7619-LM2]|jgi:hypothetical protein|nr:hypothetical protein [Stenomitos rutilans HA7619-LM2]
MSTDFAWHFFRVLPSEEPKIHSAFESSVKQSQIDEKAQAFFQSKEAESKSDQQDSFYEDYEFLFDLFYPDAFIELYGDIATGKLPLGKQQSEQAPLEFVLTNRVGASVMFFYSLGWQFISKLPGYFGNMFISPEAVAKTLVEVENVFREVDVEEFTRDAETLGAWGNANEDVARSLASLLPNSLRTVLAEGNGLLALNYPDVGSIPYPGCEDDEYEGEG